MKVVQLSCFYIKINQSTFSKLMIKLTMYVILNCTKYINQLKTSTTFLMFILLIYSNVSPFCIVINAEPTYETKHVATTSSTSSAAEYENSMESSEQVGTSTVESILPTSEISHLATQNWTCNCWTYDSSGPSTECRCEGLKIIRIPQILPTETHRITFAQVGLKTLRATGLKMYSNALQDILLSELPDFESIEDNAFHLCTSLRSIYISFAPKLKHLGAASFKGLSQTLKTLHITHCGLLAVPDLQFLSHKNILHMVDLEGNQITHVGIKSINITTEAFVLDSNALVYIDDSAFSGSQIAKLSIKNNKKLKEIHESAFAGLVNIIELDLSSTSLEHLPTEGLSTLEILRIQNTHSLKTIPSVYNFKNLRVAWLTHSFHCCAFKFPSRHDPIGHDQRLRQLAFLQKECFTKGYHKISDSSGIEDVDSVRKIRIRRWFQNNDMNATNFTSLDDLKDVDNANISQDISELPIEISSIEDFGDSFGEFHETTVVLSPNNSDEAICGNLSHKYVIDVECHPSPDALNPCEDVMGSNWLRGSVWVVLLLAVFGNAAVLVVVFSNRSDVTVPKFLISNLAFADFCMGLYLLLIAAIDAHSIGEYFNVAYDWQYGSGCKAAGFLTVFASHLSIFTLTIITLERWFAITYAIYLNKRLKLRTAAQVMLFGWTYSGIMAALPLFGMSNYSSTSICLPMEARDSLDITYLLTILGVNGLAFFVILICYAQIYFSLGKETRQVARHASRGEMTVAKKMALLVFTNFACWAPITFFALTALAGYPLIDVGKSKILLVFFYPLNSCANPYLYAILTAQYRRDLFMLLSKFGFCVQRAQQYKMTYSQPTTNQTIPVPLLGRNSVSSNHRSSTKERTEVYV